MSRRERAISSVAAVKISRDSFDCHWTQEIEIRGMSDDRPADSRNNNFGFLRVLFAALVVLSHSPELIDGNPSREILTRIFGTLTFGRVGVDGFFLISGYLITKSFIESRSLFAYLAKRIARIVPGYLVSFWICVLVIAPFVGAGATVFSWPVLSRQIMHALLLQAPAVPGVFADLPSPVLNGSMWTISYEFRCYLLIAMLGLIGLLGSPRARILVLAVVATCQVITLTGILTNTHSSLDAVLGTPDSSLELFAVFGTGALYFLFRSEIPLTSLGALAAAAALFVAMYSSRWAGPAFALLGGYIIFWFSFKTRVLFLSKFDNTTDISYGLYLYAFPIQNSIILNYRTVNPWALTAITLVLASIAASASWKLVENPSLQLLRNSRASSERRRRPTMQPENT